MIAQYSRLFRWHVLRYLAQHPLLGILNIATVALGVALYLAIQIANHSANRAFATSVDLVAGKAQLEVTAPAGNLRDELFPRIAHQPGVAAATPIVRGFVSLPQFPGEYLDLLGIDVFTNEPFRTFELTDFQAAQTFNLQQWLRGPRTIALSEEFARQHHLHAGEQIDAQINGLEFDRHQEEQAVTTFVRGIRAAAKAFQEDPLGAPLIPNWNRVQSALPAFLEELNEVVRQDNE